MKITRVEATAGSTGDYHGVVAVINHEFGPGLVGQDPRDITRIWENLYSGTRGHYAIARGHVFPAMSRRGVAISAISGIDIALWDILGKSLNAPVWRLLGGRKADSMPAYASGGWANAAQIGAQLQGYVDQSGFKAVKMRIGVFDGSPMASAERVRAARAARGRHTAAGSGHLRRHHRNHAYRGPGQRGHSAPGAPPVGGSTSLRRWAACGGGLAGQLHPGVRAGCQPHDP